MPILAFDSPLGRMTLQEEDGALVTLTWCASGQAKRKDAPTQEETPLLRAAAGQLTDYFAGRRRRFDLPLRPAGTPFQRRVYAATSAIPFGETRSYGALAAQLGSAARAVGGACGSNPIPVIIPCHRVVASGGAMGGYSGHGGLESKRSLLRLEQSFAGDAQVFRLTGG